MKKKLTHLCWLIVFVSAAFACKKDKPGADYTALLVRQPWKYDVMGADYNKDGKIDFQTTLAPCLSDELIYFFEDGNGLLDQGANLCYPAFPQTQAFTWQLLNNNTQLEYAGATYTILQLDETHLTVYTDEFVGDETIRQIARYKH
jgi:hypothetical protein